MAKLKKEKNIYRTAIGYPSDFTERITRNKELYSYEELLNEGFMVIYDVLGNEQFHNEFSKNLKEAMERYTQGTLVLEEMPQDILNKYYERIKKSGRLGDFPLRILQLLSSTQELFSKNGTRGCISIETYEPGGYNLHNNRPFKWYILTTNKDLFVEDTFHNIIQTHKVKLQRQLSSSPSKDENILAEKLDRIEKLLGSVYEITQETNQGVKIISELIKNDPQKIEAAITTVLEKMDLEEKDKNALTELKKITEISDWFERIDFWYNKIKPLSPLILNFIISSLK